MKLAQQELQVRPGKIEMARCGVRELAGSVQNRPVSLLSALLPYSRK